jgi:predicted Zn-dependent protease with MMP-like domain
LGRGPGFPVEGAIDANGCNSWIYEIASSFGPSESFFAGTGFRSGQFAFQYGTKETTEVLDGHQLIRVKNPSKLWRRVYAGYDVCTTDSTTTGPAGTVCLAPALLRRPDIWTLEIVIGVLLGALVLSVVHFMRPAGPIRRRRRYRRAHEPLLVSITGATPGDRELLDLRQLQKRLRRLERALGGLTVSQHHWFNGLVVSGRHGLALEALARWMAESTLPIPDHLREEASWIASSLAIEHHVTPILDAEVRMHDADGPDDATATRAADAPGEGWLSNGFDVPLAEFQDLVAAAVDSLPPVFGRAMTNVAVVVAEEHPDRDRLGQYEGLPLARNPVRWAIRPDKITIYRRTICAHCHSRAAVEAMVYRVVIHEIAHHFGIDDPRLRELGW